MKRSDYCSSTALRKYKTTDDEMSAKVLKFSSNTFFSTIAKFTTESAILVFRFEQLILFFLLLWNYRNLLIVQFGVCLPKNYSSFMVLSSGLYTITLDTVSYCTVVTSYKPHPIYITHCIYFTVYLTTEKKKLFYNLCKHMLQCHNCERKDDNFDIKFNRFPFLSLSLCGSAPHSHLLLLFKV